MRVIGLIADEPRGAVHRVGVAALGLEIGLGARDEEGPRLVQPVQALEIEIAPVHDVEGAGSGNNSSSTLTSCSFPSEMWMKVGMLPRRSISVCSLIAPWSIGRVPKGTASSTSRSSWNRARRRSP